MNINWIKKRIIKPKNLYSLLIYYQIDGKAICSWVLTENIKGDFKIKESGYSETIEECISQFNKKIPIIITIEGKGIIHKQVDKTSLVPLFKQALSNGIESDFYVQHYDFDEKSAFISIIRNSTLIKLFDEIAKKQINIIAFSIGFYCLDILSKYIEKKDEIDLGETIVKFLNGKIHTVIHSHYFNPKGTVVIAGETIQKMQLVPFSLAIAYMNDFPNIVIENNIFEIQFKNYLHKKYLKIGIFITLFLFLIILFLNFIFYTKYFNEINKTERILSQNSNVLKQISDLKQEIEIRKSILDNTNIANEIKFSYIAEQITICMPEQITLLEFTIFPFEGKNSTKSFSKNSIFIKGTTVSSEYINLWIKSLKKESWIKSVEIGSYQLEGNTYNGLFELTIKTNFKNVQ